MEALSFILLCGTDHTVTQAVLGFPTVQAALELLTLLPPLPQCWDARCYSHT